MSSTDNTPGAAAPDPTGAVRAALAEVLRSTDIEIVADVSDRMPTGETVRLVTAAIRGKRNRTAALAVDAAAAVHRRDELEARAGRPLFIPDVHPPTGPVVVRRDPVRINPISNNWTLPKCATEHETVVVTIPKSGANPKADVYLLADTTGSMAPVIDAVKAGSTTIIGSFPGVDVAWGVGNYRDFPVPGSSSYAFAHQLSPSASTVPAALAAVAAWTTNGEGGDAPEGQLYALHRIATDPATGWRPGSKRIIVWFGDAPGHDPVCASLTGLPADLTQASVTTDLAGHTVIAVSTTTGLPAGLDDNPAGIDYPCAAGGTPGQATEIAAATGGSHTTGVDAGAIVDTLAKLIAAAVGETGSVTLAPTGQITGFVTGITPAGGYGPLPGNVQHVLPFEVVWTGDRDCGDKDQVFTGALDVVADGVVVASKPVTVTVPACRWHHSVEMVCGVEGPDPADPADDCRTVVDGRYATAVTIYNPTSCPIRIEKRFATLVRQGRVIGREPDRQPARRFAEIVLLPGEATMDDCCSLREVAGPTGGPLVLGVLDIVADGRLEVTAIHTATSVARSATTGAAIHTRVITPRRA